MTFGAIGCSKFVGIKRIITPQFHCKTRVTMVTPKDIGLGERSTSGSENRPLSEHAGIVRSTFGKRGGHEAHL